MPRVRVRSSWMCFGRWSSLLVAPCLWGVAWWHTGTSSRGAGVLRCTFLSKRRWVHFKLQINLVSASSLVLNNMTLMLLYPHNVMFVNFTSERRGASFFSKTWHQRRPAHFCFWKIWKNAHPETRVHGVEWMCWGFCCTESLAHLQGIL